MRRPAIGCACAFSLGMFISRELLVPRPAAWGLLCAALIPVLFLKRRKYFCAALFAAFLFLGCLREGLTRIIPRDDISNFFPEGKGAITGRVESIPEIRMKGRREKISFVMSVQSVSFGGEQALRSGKVQVSFFNSRADLEYGDRVRLYGELRIPPAATFPGEFDYRKYLENRGIRRIFFGFGGRSVSVLGKSGDSIFKRVFSVRSAILKKLDSALPFPENQILAALVVGARKGIPEGITEDFRRTGTTHILAVSGMNVSIVSGFIFLLLRLCFIPRRLNALLSLFFIGIYVLLSGCNAPVARAGIMGAILMFGLFLEKESELANSLAIAFFILLFVNPGNLWACDFQLSFLSVLGIFLFGPGFTNECLIDEHGRRERPSVWRRIGRFYLDILRVTLAAMIATWPLLVYYFRLFSPVSFPANMLILPFMNFATFAGFLILPVLFIFERAGVLLAFFPLAAVRLSIECDHWLARIPFGHFYFPPVPAGVLWIYYGGFLPLLALSGRKIRAVLKRRAEAKKMSNRVLNV